jgi:hypothetical protein
LPAPRLRGSCAETPVEQGFSPVCPALQPGPRTTPST